MRWLLALMAAALMFACRMSFDEARPKAPVKEVSVLGLSVAGTKLEQPGSPKCNALDTQQVVLGITGYSLEAAGGGLAATAVDPKLKEKTREILLVAGIGTAAGGVGFLWGRVYTAQEWTALGCAGSPVVQVPVVKP